MVFAEIKHIYGLEVPELKAFVPEQPGEFCIHVRLMVGPRGTSGEESFDFGVCSAGWLNRMCEKDGFVLGRHFLIVKSFDGRGIENVLTKLVEGCSGSTWSEVAQKVARIGYWEFEDYRAD